MLVPHPIKPSGLLQSWTWRLRACTQLIISSKTSTDWWHCHCACTSSAVVYIVTAFFLVVLVMPSPQLQWVNGHHDQYLFPVVSDCRIMSILNHCFSRLPAPFFFYFFFFLKPPLFPLLKERKSLQIQLNKWFSGKPLIIHLSPLT